MVVGTPAPDDAGIPLSVPPVPVPPVLKPPVVAVSPVVALPPVVDRVAPSELALKELLLQPETAMNAVKAKVAVRKRFKKIFFTKPPEDVL